MRAEEFIRNLARDGCHHFTTDDAIKEIGGNGPAVRAQLKRLKDAGRIVSPIRSFHVMVPPEYLRIGCPPAEHFIDQMMGMLGEVYYIGLLSAAERYGAAHQRPQSLQVMVRKNRPTISCGKVRIVFVARGDVEQMPVRKFNTPFGTIRYSTPEMTALEMVGYPLQAGGLSNVATVLAELAESMDKEKLVEAAELSPVGWAQRLGYLLEFVEQPALADALATFVAANAHSYTQLRRTGGVTGAQRNSKWKLVINAEVDPDL